MNRTASDVLAFPAAPGRDSNSGYGLLRADRALHYIRAPRQLVHVLASNPYLYSSSVADRTFYDTPNEIGYTGPVPTDIYVYRQDVSFPATFVETPDVWIRTSGTLGVIDVGSYYNYHRELTGGRVVPGTLTPTGCTVETTIYRVHMVNGYLRWWPTDSDNVRIALTAVGSTSNTAPGVIDDLQKDPRANFSSGAWLNWSAPVDDGNDLRAVEYDLRYSLNPINESNFTDAIPVSLSFQPGRAGQFEQHTIQGLAFCTTYHMAIRSRDAAGQWSPISSSLSFTTYCDQQAPPAVANVTPGYVTNWSAELDWTPPVDPPSGQALAAYDLRRSTAPITEQNFAQATPAGPQPGTTANEYVWTGLAACQEYYFALKSKDAFNHWSAMSNVAHLITAGCGGGGGGEEDPPILQHSGRGGEGQVAYRLTEGSISFSVFLGSGQSPVKLEIFDVRGRLLKTVISGEGAPGWHNVSWRFDDNGGRPVSPGVLFTSLTVPGIRRVGKLAILP